MHIYVHIYTYIYEYHPILFIIKIKFAVLEPGDITIHMVIFKIITDKTNNLHAKIDVIW